MSRIAFVFPGQGAQRPGMGRELADELPECREVFEAADGALDRPISDLCFEGPDDALALTANTQPAILTVSVAAARALQRRGLRPAAAAGHSLGEYSAHVAVGTLEFTDAVRTVRNRGEFMQEAVPVGVGAMAAILGLELPEVERICGEAAGSEVVGPANLNGPGQIVIAGHAAAVQRAVEACAAAGARRAVPLDVSAPFHCELMKPAADRLRPVLDAVSFRKPEVPVFTNVDARPVIDGDAARDALIRQVASPVRWHELVQEMIGAGIDTFVEVGPGKVLSGLVRRIDRTTRVFNVCDPNGVEKVARELGVTA